MFPKFGKFHETGARCATEVDQSVVSFKVHNILSDIMWRGQLSTFHKYQFVYVNPRAIADSKQMSNPSIQ